MGIEGDEYRITCSTYENKSKRFVCDKVFYENQYFHIYASRLAQLSKCLQKGIHEWISKDETLKLIKLHETEMHLKAIVIGTIVKQMHNRPNVLKQLAENNSLMMQPHETKLYSEKDEIFIEDELQRAKILGNCINPQKLIHGCVVAICATENEKGELIVEDIIYPESLESVPYPVLEDERYLMFVSGLGVCGDEQDFNMKFMLDCLLGYTTRDSQMRSLMNKVMRVVIAGNLLSKKLHLDNIQTRARYVTQKLKIPSFQAINQLDAIFSKILMSCELDVMPGDYDPSNHALPQQAFKHCLFPNATKFSTFSLVTNPYHANIDGVEILGTSGQNIKNIQSVSSLQDEMEIMHQNILSCHISPTSPDTLGGTKDVLLLLIPEFSESACCVLLNLKSFTASPLSFECSLPITNS